MIFNTCSLYMQTQVLMYYYDEEKCIDILILFTITKRQSLYGKRPLRFAQIK